MSLILLDPNPLQIELLNKLDLVMKDVEGNIIFEAKEEEEKNED